MWLWWKARRWWGGWGREVVWCWGEGRKKAGEEGMKDRFAHADTDGGSVLIVRVRWGKKVDT